MFVAWFRRKKSLARRREQEISRDSVLPNYKQTYKFNNLHVDAKNMIKVGSGKIYSLREALWWDYSAISHDPQMPRHLINGKNVLKTPH
jgi:hypothetical protein